MVVPSFRWAVVFILHVMLLALANYKVIIRNNNISSLIAEDDAIFIEGVTNEIKSTVEKELSRGHEGNSRPVLMQDDDQSSASKANEELLKEMDKLRQEMSSIRSEYDKRLRAMEQELQEAKKRADADLGEAEEEEEENDDEEEQQAEEEGDAEEDDDDDAENDDDEETDGVENKQNMNKKDKKKTTTGEGELLNRSILKLKAPQGLTRMSTRGVDFMDKWRPIPYKFTEQEMQVIYNGFGADDLDPKNCTTKSKKRKAIAGRLAYHGLGMNLIQLANYIMYASHHPQGFFFVFLPFTFFNIAKKQDSHHFQVWFEQKFVMASEPDSYCDIFAEKCDKVEGRCYDVWWENPETNPKLYYWRQAVTWLDQFRRKNPALHDAYKTVLIRETLRMRPEARSELDKHHAKALEGLNSKNKNAYHVAIHIRRTDKITGEAKKIESNVFVDALAKIMDGLDSNKKVIVHLMSDDSEVGHEFNQAIEANEIVGPQMKRIHVHFRYALHRPDRTSPRRVDEGFWHLLVDLRLMIESDAFIGSQSSNVGVVVCYLRVHENCLSVEDHDFNWNAARNKIA